MSKLGPKCQYFVWPSLFSSHAFTLLGMEFTFCLRMPHRLPLPSATLARQWLSWRCVWGRYHVEILPCDPVSEGRGSCSASVCHSTCWHSWLTQWTIASQCRQNSCTPRPWHSHYHAWLKARHTCLCTPHLVAATHAWHNLKFILVSSDYRTCSSNPCPWSDCLQQTVCRLSCASSLEEDSFWDDCHADQFDAVCGWTSSE